MRGGLTSAVMRVLGQWSSVTTTHTGPCAISANGEGGSRPLIAHTGIRVGLSQISHLHCMPAKKEILCYFSKLKKQGEVVMIRPVFLFSF